MKPHLSSLTAPSAAGENHSSLLFSTPLCYTIITHCSPFPPSTTQPPPPSSLRSFPSLPAFLPVITPLLLPAFWLSLGSTRGMTDEQEETRDGAIKERKNWSEHLLRWRDEYLSPSLNSKRAVSNSNETSMDAILNIFPNMLPLLEKQHMCLMQTREGTGTDWDVEVFPTGLWRNNRG